MNDPLTHRVEVSPEATALIDADRDKRLTVADLDAAVERTAGRLSALGVRPGDRLGVLLPTGVAAARTVHAAIRLGATVVPLGPRLAVAELTDRLDRAGVTALVCDASTEAAAVDAAAAMEGAAVPVASVDDPSEATALAARTPEAVVPYDWSLGATLFVPFTSGTTGTFSPAPSPPPSASGWTGRKPGTSPSPVTTSAVSRPSSGCRCTA